MGLGIIGGVLLGEHAAAVSPVGELFIRLLLMAAIPLVFFNVVSGITSLSDIDFLGRLGVKTFLYYLITTSTALWIGLIAAGLVKPGEGMHITGSFMGPVSDVPNISDLVLDLVPENAINAFRDGNVGQVLVVGLFVGIASLLLPTAQKERLQGGFALAAGLLRQMVKVVLKFAPISIGALVAATVGEYGSEIFGPLARFVLAIWMAQVVMVILYMGLLYFTTRRAPLAWLRETAPLYATSAATCSSLASLVVSMNVAKTRLKLPENVYNFTLPLGAQLNKDGTAIMLTAVLIFTAQASNISLSYGDLWIVVLFGLLIVIGSGGIPTGGLVVAIVFVQAFGLPLELIGVVAGVYRLIDMGNTTVNCMSDMVLTTILSDSESRKADAAP